LVFFVDEKGGNGSHYKIICDNGKSITIPKRLDKDVLYYLIKEIEKYSDCTWEDMKKLL